MIKRVFIATLASMALTGYVMAHGNNLWEHFNKLLPARSERALMYYDYGGEEVYSGTKDQNIFLLDAIHENVSLGSLAAPPSTTEGTSTAGWTDDGSVVRLNTANDSVGIGTTNPTQKLSVVGGNIYTTGTLDVGTGTFNFGTGVATSTLSSASGNLGIGSTTPRDILAVQGGTMISGTTTVGALVASTTQINGSLRWNGVSYIGPSADGGNNNTLITNGSGTLSWSSATRGSILLSAPATQAIGVSSTTLASVTVGASDMASGEIIRVTAMATSSFNTGSRELIQDLSLSLGGNATSTCGIAVRASPGYATTTYNFIIRANSSTAQSLTCNTIIEQSGGATAHKNNTGADDTAGSYDLIDRSVAIGAVNLANAQTLMFVLGPMTQWVTGNHSSTIFGVTVELLNL